MHPYRKERTPAEGAAPSWPCRHLGPLPHTPDPYLCVCPLCALPLHSVKGLSQRTGLGLSKSCSGSLETEAQRLMAMRHGDTGYPVWGSPFPSVKWASPRLDPSLRHRDGGHIAVCCSPVQQRATLHTRDHHGSGSVTTALTPA